MNQLIPITQLALPIPAAMSDLAWQQAGTAAPVAQRWNVYLNRIATQLLTEYLVEDFPDLRVGVASLQENRSEDGIWQFFNGSVLQLNAKRVVLLPTKTIDNSELIIPQEWVDIPAWAGDYFLAVQIDPDAQLLHCWGYTTHQMMKSQARYDANDRTYHLDADDLIADVSGLWVVQQLNPDEITQTAIAPLVAVATTQAENLLQRLATIPNPRLEIPFGLWGALIGDRNWRQRLVAIRQGAAAPSIELTTTVNRLGDWMQNIFASGWQAVEDFWSEDAELALRQPETVTPTVRRVKAIQLPDRVLLLLLAVASETDDSLSERLHQRLEIKVKLRSSDRTDILPAGVTLELLAGDDRVLQSVTTRDRDNAIKLPRFRSTAGTEFKLQVRSDTTIFCESFLV
jgi:hypothetical protein